MGMLIAELNSLPPNYRLDIALFCTTDLAIFCTMMLSILLPKHSGRQIDW
jgi:hypothetical protein